jgi:hypothetical protein
LQKELDESLREFDEMLVREQETLQGRREDPGGGSAATGSGAAAGAGAGSGAGSSQAGGAHAGGAGGSGSGEGDGGGATPSGPGGSTSSSGASAAPAGVPDGSDDDVVARQLREAALNEKDPKLRQKLWKEYCDYKKSTGGQQCKEVPAPPETKGENGEQKEEEP